MLPKIVPRQFSNYQLTVSSNFKGLGYGLYTKILICKVTSKKQSTKNVTKHKERRKNSKFELDYLFYSCVPALRQRLRSDFRERPGQTLVRGQEVQRVSS